MAKKSQSKDVSAKTVFLNTESWSGNNFSVLPGEIIDWLPVDIAEARELAGLGTIIKG